TADPTDVRRTTSATDTLCLHDALPICLRLPMRGTSPSTLQGTRPTATETSPAIRSTRSTSPFPPPAPSQLSLRCARQSMGHRSRSEEHTSELQSLRHLVCRLLLEKKND